MIIGVDAGALSIRDERLRVGVWQVTYNLLRELGKLDKKNSYRLYTFRAIDRGVMRAFGPRMENIILRPALAWSVIQLPLELYRHPVDVFLGLSQMLPYSTSHIRMIGFIHDLGFLHFPEAYPGSLKRLISQTKQLVRHADHIVTVSQASKQDIKNNYHDIPPVSVVYEGVDGRFTLHGTKHKHNHPYFLCVGALKRGKNIPFALRAFKRFNDNTKQKFDFIIAGGNYWEDPEIASTIKKLGLGSRVKLTGFVSDKELASFYRGAEALVITSLREGFCLPAVEAMASGCPVVYVKAGSLPEIVGKAGIPFDPYDEKGASAALRQITSNSKLCSTCISIGVKRSSEFTWARFAQEVYRIMTST